MLERDLTPAEIEERTALRDQLDDERDDLIGAVEQRRREIRGFNASRKRLESRIRDVRRELRSGKVQESRQMGLALDEPEARHGEGELLDPVKLQLLVMCTRPAEHCPTVAEVEAWHPQVRADVQRWCRAQHARANPIAGLPLPPVMIMPNVLENVAFDREPPRKRKAGKRKASKRKAAKR